jgi:CelD/BcsL family acetyltransferase involved in cellulose biosynthesis
MFDDDDPRWDLFEECVEVVARTWQGTSTTGTTLSHAQVLPFFRATHAAAVHHGAVDVNLLRLDGKAIAFGYNYASNGMVYGLRMGYDREFAELSPGHLLLARSIKDSCRRGDRCLDLGPESLSVKRVWKSRTMSSRRCTHYAWSTPHCQLLRLKRWLVEQQPGKTAVN